MLALNEEAFVSHQLRILYPFCSGISVLTQFDRDWYGKRVTPDSTFSNVANFPDPEGKIHLVLRRWRDQAAALNCEMAALSANPHRNIISHGSTREEISKLHDRPDYFWIVDSDEFYDVESLPSILGYLEKKRPRGMRMLGYNYLGSWNRRVPTHLVRFCQFGFIRPGVRFESIRHTSFNESRLSKALKMARLPDFSSRLFGFIECPSEIGVFHHGCWLGDRARLVAKFSRSAHTWSNNNDHIDAVGKQQYEFIPTSSLPRTIQEIAWPKGYLESGSS